MLLVGGTKYARDIAHDYVQFLLLATGEDPSAYEDGGDDVLEFLNVAAVNHRDDSTISN